MKLLELGHGLPFSEKAHIAGLELTAYAKTAWDGVASRTKPISANRQLDAQPEPPTCKTTWLQFRPDS
jgi:hypothetical protein